MSRLHDADMDIYDDGSACSSGCGYCGRCGDGPHGNATCSDCQQEFWKGPDDVGSLCDACCAQRDRWAEAYQIRMAHAPVPMPNHIPTVDVALVPIREPADYGRWLDALRANAAYGSDALARAWYESSVEHQIHLLTVAPDLWLTLKAISVRQAA